MAQSAVTMKLKCGALECDYMVVEIACGLLQLHICSKYMGIKEVVGQVNHPDQRPTIIQKTLQAVA